MRRNVTNAESDTRYARLVIMSAMIIWSMVYIIRKAFLPPNTACGGYWISIVRY